MGTPLDQVVLEEFENLYGWKPDAAQEVAIAASVARRVCTRLEHELPELDWPTPYATFAAALGASSASTPSASSTDALPEVSSGGGPVLVAPQALAAHWRGTDGEAPTDYDRACEPRGMTPTEYGGVGFVDVSSGVALVLDLELVTTVVVSDGGATLVRNYDEEPTEAAIRARIEAVPAGAWQSLSEPLQVPGGGLVMFDAAMPGAADVEDIESDEGVATIALGPGTYRVDLATVEGVDLIRLVART